MSKTSYIDLLAVPTYQTCLKVWLFCILAAGGKPSTWLPPGGLVEHIVKKKNKQLNKQTK